MRKGEAISTASTGAYAPYVAGVLFIGMSLNALPAAVSSRVFSIDMGGIADITNLASSKNARVSHAFVPEQEVKRAHQVLGLSKSHIARIFQVSRPTLYSWLENKSSASPDNRRRIEQVSEALDRVESVFPYRVGASALTVRKEGKSLFDVLTEENIDLSEVGHITRDIRSVILSEERNSLKDSTVSREEFSETFSAT